MKNWVVKRSWRIIWNIFIKSVEHLSPKGILESIKQKHDYTSMNDTFWTIFKLLKRIEKKLFDNVNFSPTPNMNTVYVKNHNNFSKAHLVLQILSK